MDKQLVVLKEGGAPTVFQDGSGPFDAVRIIDEGAGLQGQKFFFPSDWQAVIERAYGRVLPHYVQYDLREIPSCDKVAAMTEVAARLIQRIRREATEPFSIPVAEDGRIGIEFQPTPQDNRVAVACRFMGDTVVNYTDDGLVVDIFSSSEMLVPKHSLQFNANDLMGDGDGSQDGFS